VTANEGDAKDYDGFSRETRVAKLALDSTMFPNAEELQKPPQLGRVKTSDIPGESMVMAIKIPSMPGTVAPSRSG
jgi:hypothetical protein